MSEDDDTPVSKRSSSACLEDLTDRARLVVSIANHEAHQICWPYIGSEHLLLGMLRDEGNVAAKALHAVGINFEALRG
jgi:ATP-dependent Clp protease ATP-binding subunit ClpC